MKKEVKKARIETALPLPHFYIVFVVVVALLAHPAIAPSPKQWNDWVTFNGIFIAVVFIFCLPAVILNWPFHPRCTLSRKQDHRYLFWRVVSYYWYDGRPSIGKVQVVRKNGGNAVWEFFCAHCDPDRPYFQQVLCERYKEVLRSSMIRFWLVENDGNEDDRRGEDHEDEPPDIRLSS